MRIPESEGVETGSEKIERNVLVAVAAWIWESIWPVSAGVLLTLLFVGGWWIIDDYRKVRVMALHGQQLFEWAQMQNKQQQEVQAKQVQPQAPKVEEKKP